MQFRQFQLESHRRTAWLLLCFFVLLLALAGFVNLVLALGWRLLMPFSQGFPALFFETNTALVMFFVIGGALVELDRLRSGGGIRVAHWLGGAEVSDNGDALHRRLLNVVDEMAIASGQPAPDSATLAELLASLGIDGRRVAQRRAPRHSPPRRE